MNDLRYLQINKFKQISTFTARAAETMGP